jgi:hypothetical protein
LVRCARLWRCQSGANRTKRFFASFFFKKEVLPLLQKTAGQFFAGLLWAGDCFIPTMEGLMKISYALPAFGMLTRGMFNAV